MKYRTEMMEEILTSPQAQKIIDYLTPIYGNAYVCLWIFQAIGVILDEGESFPDEYMDQVTPATATWTIEFWEKEYGIVPDSTLTIEQRRNNLMNKITSMRPINPKRIEEVVSQFYGVESSIEENTAKNTFTIEVHDFINNLDAVRSAVDEIKPAHLIYHFKNKVNQVINGYYQIFCTEIEKNVVEKADKTITFVATDENDVIFTNENGELWIL